MSITVVTYLCCENKGCGMQFQFGPDSKALPRQARKDAKTHGWTRVAGKDYCPDHKPVWKKVLVPAS